MFLQVFPDKVSGKHLLCGMSCGEIEGDLFVGTKIILNTGVTPLCTLFSSFFFSTLVTQSVIAPRLVCNKMFHITYHI